ncbi:Panacea domain-containing protein [Chloroflexota bacterium]
MIPAIEVARYFLSLTDEDAGELISNLKLQKLLYYAQGFHLAIFDEPLFTEPLEAWAHGPVVPEVYRHFRDYGSDPIQPEEFDADGPDGETQEFLDEIYSIFGQYSAWKLREMTHDEPPWENFYEEGEVNVEIPHDALQEYFISFVEETE